MEPILNNRELSLALWLIVFLVFIFASKTIRPLAIQTIKLFSGLKIIIPFVLTFVPIAVLIVILNKTGVWEISLIKDSVVWVSGTAIVMFMHSTKIRDGSKYFKHVLKDILKVFIIIEFIINFYVFPLPVELVFIPFIVLLTAMATFTSLQKEKKYIPVKKFFNIIQVLVGIVILIYVLIHLITEPKELFTIQNLKSFLLPVIYTVLYLPSIYFLAIYSAYDSLFVRIKTYIPKQDRIRVRLALARRAKFNIPVINTVIQPIVLNHLNEYDLITVLNLIKNYQKHAAK